MIELPEALTISKQLNDAAVGKVIKDVKAAFTPHKFCWFHGDPESYRELLTGQIVDGVNGYGGTVEIKAGHTFILFNDGVGVKFHGKGGEHPKKHQLLVEFDDGSALSACVQLYGGISCFNDGDYDNPYYKAAKEKPSPLSDAFDSEYFNMMISSDAVQKLSAKAFLATEQRIPGLGNGVLHDILWNAKIHPKRKINTLSQNERETLFISTKKILSDMTAAGGRDNEKDLYGNNGGYITLAGKSKDGFPCLECGGHIVKENYLGGSIYYCENCQNI